MAISKWLSYTLYIRFITSIRKITLTNKLWKKRSNELSYTIYKNIYVTVHYIVYGAGATRSSVPLLQYCRISWNKYLFLSSLKPSGLIWLGRMPCCGKFEGSFSNMKDCSTEKLFSLKKNTGQLAYVQTRLRTNSPTTCQLAYVGDFASWRRRVHLSNACLL